MADLFKTLDEYHEIYLRYAKANGRKQLHEPTDDLKECVSRVKTEIQYKVLSKWWARGQVGFFRGGTGIGKTRCGIRVAAWDIEQQLKADEEVTCKTLISLRGEDDRDFGWPKEFDRWAEPGVIDHVILECHPTTLKRRHEHWNTLVVDEAHWLMTAKGKEFFTNNTFDKILLLSATVKGNKLKLMQELGIPLVYDYPIEQGEEDGIVSPSLRFVLELDLTEEERENYNKKEELVTELAVAALCKPGKEYTQAELINIKARRGTVLGLSQGVIRFGKTFPGHNRGNSIKLARAYMRAVNDRKSVVFFSLNKLKAIQRLHHELILPNGDQAITFGELTATVDALVDWFDTPEIQGYHSNMKSKERRLALDKFRKGEIKSLISAKALNEGVDITGVKYGFCISGNSSELQKTQQEGRTFRWELGKQAVFVTFICKDTVERNWVNNSYRGRKAKPIWVSSVDELINKIKTVH